MVRVPFNLSIILLAIFIGWVASNPPSTLSAEELPGAGVAPREDADESEEAKDLLTASLLEGLRTDFDKYRDAIPELRQLADSPSERLNLDRVLASGYQRTGEIELALEAYLRLADSPRDDQELDALDSRWSVRRDVWLRSRIRDLWLHAQQEGEPATFGTFQSRVRERLHAADMKGIQALEGELRIFADLPCATEARSRFAEASFQGGHALQAIRHWNRLSRDPDPTVRRLALLRLCRAYEQCNANAEAAAVIRQIVAAYPDEPYVNEQKVSDYTRSLPADSPLRLAMTTAYDWPVGRVVVDVRRENRNTPRRETFIPPLDRAGLEPASSPLIFDSEDESLSWRSPLGSVSWSRDLADFHDARIGFHYDPLIRYYQKDAGLLVVSAGLQRFAFDLTTDSANEEPLWREEFLNGRKDPSAIRDRRFPRDAEWGRRGKFVRDRLGIISSPGLLIEDTWIACRRMALEAFDCVTHELLWRRESIRPGSFLFGDRDAMFVVPPECDVAQVFDPISGEYLGEREVPAEDRRVSVIGRQILAWNHERDQARLALIDVLSGEERWMLEIGAGAKLAQLPGERELAVATSDGRIILIELPSGRVIGQSTWEPAGPMRQAYYLPFGETRLLIIDREVALGAGGTRSLLGQHVQNGVMMAFDARSGNKLWTAEINDQTLLNYYPEAVPVVTLVGVTRDRSEDPGRTSHGIQVFDLRTGEKLVQLADLPGETRFVHVEGDPLAKMVAITTRAARVELTFREE